MATYRVPVLDEFSWQPPVKDKELTAPPGGEAKGDRYIVASVATGAWSGLENHIVTYNGATWIDATPVEGWQCWIEDENLFYQYTGAAWETAAASAGDITSIDTRATNIESSVGSIDTNLTGTDSSVGSIDTRVSVNESTNVVQSTSISTNVVAIASNALVGDSNASSVVSINTRATNIESSVGSINTAKQDKGTYVSEYGAIEFTI